MKSGRTCEVSWLRLQSAHRTPSYHACAWGNIAAFMLPHIVISIGPARAGARMFFIGYIYDILSVRTLILPASSAFILSIHVPDTGSIPRSIAIAIPVCRANGTGRGFAIAIEISWLSLSALSACPAQAGVPTAQVEETNPKRIIRIESPPCLQPSSAFILSIHVPATGSTPQSIAIAIGIAIAIETSRLSLSALSALSALRLSACPAQAGTGRRANGTGRGHQPQENHFDRISAILTRLGGRGHFLQEDIPPTNRERLDSDSDPDPDSEKKETRRVKPFLPRLGQYRSDHASPYRYIDRPTQRRQSARQVVRGVPTRNKVGRSLVAHAAPGGHVPPAQARAVFF